MQRVTVTLDDDLMAELDRLMADGGYANRSEAIRDLTRPCFRRVGVTISDSPSIARLIACGIGATPHEVADETSGSRPSHHH